MSAGHNGVPVRLALPAERPLAALADALLRSVSGPVGLSESIVLLPHRGLLAELGHALRDAAGQPCPLPRVLTLSQWVALQPVPPVSVSRTRIIVELQRQLRSQKWLGHTDRWAFAAELADLFEALCAAGVELATDIDALTALLQRAYQARDTEPLRFEARLVHQLWFATHGDPALGLTAPQRHLLALRSIADQASQPLWVVDAARFSPIEQAFFDDYARRAPVTLADPQVDAGAAAGWVAASAGLGVDATAAMAERAANWAQQFPQAPGGISTFAALGQEDEAAHARDTLCQWLAEGRQSIALVATDRALARRLRALLEARGVLLQDAAGWSLATTRVGAGLAAWLTALRRPTAAALAAWLDSPLAPAESGGLTCALRTVPANARLDWHALDHKLAGDAEALGVLQQLQESWQRLRGGARPLAQWLDDLLSALQYVAPQLADDAAGAQLLEHLQASAEALRGDGGLLARDDLAQWLDWSLGQTLFRERDVHSPVILADPGATRCQTFDAVLVCGASDGRLPSPPAQRRAIRDAARRELGLPTASDRRRQSLEDWCLLLASAPEVLISWQQLDDAAEPLGPSPWLGLLQAFHRLAWGVSLPQAARFAALPMAVAPVLAAAEQVSLARPLAQLSASAYRNLLDCPFRFHVVTRLGLQQPDDTHDSLDKRDYGNLVHRILQDFHRSVPELGAIGETAATQRLIALSQRHFEARVEAGDHTARGWWWRWSHQVPAYIAWQAGREAEGWRICVAESEQPVCGPMRLGGRSVELRGRPDRVDQRDSKRAVLDYKTSAASALRGLQQAPDEDAQLVIYARLLRDVDQLGYVPLDDEGPLKPVYLEGVLLQEVVSGHFERLDATLARIAAGAALPAMGDDLACRFCHAEGLCRRSHRARLAIPAG